MLNPKALSTAERHIEEVDVIQAELDATLARSWVVNSAAVYGHGDDARAALLAVLAGAENAHLIDNASTMLIEVTFGDKDFDATLVVVE